VIPFDGPWLKLDVSAGQLLPLCKDTSYSFEVSVDVESSTILEVELQISSKIFNYTPDILIESQKISLKKGKNIIPVSFKSTLKENQYGFIIFRKNPFIKIRCSEKLITGIVSVFNKTNPAVNNFGKQTPPENSGFDSFEFWCPERRPNGQNIAMKISPGISLFEKDNIINGYTRPYIRPNAWIAGWDDKNPSITLKWNEPQIIRTIILYFDTDFDHPMESSQMGHPESVMPFCIKNFEISDANGKLIASETDNHQTIRSVKLPEAVITNRLQIKIKSNSELALASVFEIGIY
jgi:hypothetical protein